MQIDAPAIVAAFCGAATMAAIFVTDAVPSAAPVEDWSGRIEAAFAALPVGSAAYGDDRMAALDGPDHFEFDLETGELRPMADDAESAPAAPDGAVLVVIAPPNAADALFVYDMTTGEAHPMATD